MKAKFYKLDSNIYNGIYMLQYGDIIVINSIDHSSGLEHNCDLNDHRWKSEIFSPEIDYFLCPTFYLNGIDLKVENKNDKRKNIPHYVWTAVVSNNVEEVKLAAQGLGLLDVND